MSIIRSWRTFLAAVLLVVAEGAAAAQGDAGTELLKAAGDGDVLRIKALLADGAPLEARDEDGNTPLLRATLGNHEVAASVLMKAGADVNAKNRIEDSAYLYAGARGYNEILTLTLRHGADIRSTNRYGGTALIPACERGLAETARLLLRAGVNPITSTSWAGPRCWRPSSWVMAGRSTRRPCWNCCPSDQPGRGGQATAQPLWHAASAARTPSSTCCAPLARADGAHQWGGGTRRRT